MTDPTHINLGNLKGLQVCDLWGGVILFSGIPNFSFDHLRIGELAVEIELEYENGIGRSVRAHYYPKSFFEEGTRFALESDGDLDKDERVPKNILAYKEGSFKWETINS